MNARCVSENPDICARVLGLCTDSKRDGNPSLEALRARPRRLCDERRAAEWLDDDAIVRMFVGILMAAFDTTACGLTSMAYMLAKHPEWQERLRDEARSLDQSRVSYEATRRLVLTECVWKETLRFMPITTGLPRVALRDTELNGGIALREADQPG